MNWLRVILFIALAGVVWVLFEVLFFQVKRYNFINRELEGLSIVFLTDFHYSSSLDKQKMRRLVKKTNQLNPDIIILGGDYTNDEVGKIKDLFDVLGGLEAKHGIYAVSGNHDYAEGYQQVLKEQWEKHGIVSLDNERAELSWGSKPFLLVGVPDMTHEEANLSEMLKDVDASTPVILISHQPDYAMKLTKAEHEKVDLMLSGHTHGGQITFFGYAMYMPTSYGQLFKSGHVEVEGTDVVISNGVGESIIPVRFCAPAQIVHIVFEA